MDDQKTAPRAGSGVVSVEFGPAEFGYYLSGDDGQPWPEKVWCEGCADAAVFHYRKRRGMRGLYAMECWGGDDSVKFCAGCRKVLNTGFLTSYAIDDELESYGESPPDKVCLESSQILAMMLDDMSGSDPRRATAEAWFSIASGGLVR